ncbi:chemotaxis protein CheB [Jiella mangrovi]|uniref:Blue-light-activated histidine kinase n=1 Tax=Jiella mangrovi TaxID=2821407 RepID=A0ABS4BM31_9HYPH|nr:chemotaxis protein CheB [Jiella mangrovi]MBP0617784.1 PAS domain-containing protein [Jiella mangrovi]
MDAQAGVAVPVIGVGASAGGLEAIREMLNAAGPETHFAIVIVQHLDPTHESLLAELLARHTTMPVRQVEGGELVRPGEVHVIPPGHKLEIRGGRLELTEFIQPRGLRRPIDDFFESLARDQGSNAACVILSGTGADGTTGLRAVKEHGGLCIAQDPDTAKYDGMPVSAVGTGLVDFVRAPGGIVACLKDFFDRQEEGGPREGAAAAVADHVDDICSTLREVIGHDFSGYKRTTLVRRIDRRMKVLGIKTPQDYLDRIRSSSDECDALFRDLMINVTRFFRDPEMFEVLREKVIAPLVSRRGTNDEVRVWVSGCSSGEEAYSIAILIADALRGLVERPFVHVFATDIDERMLAIAREGKYPLSAMADIPERLRQQHTVAHENFFQMSAKIRDMVRFSSHSIIKDPPFSRLDLISCRNMLIYFDERLQRQVFPILHYSLKPDGMLFLGPSESIGRHEDMFADVDRKARIFRRLKGRTPYPIRLTTDGQNTRPRRERHPSSEPSSDRPAVDTVLRRLADRYAPASVVADRDGAVLRTTGRLSKYLEFPDANDGEISVTQVARPGLREVLPALLRQAIDKAERTIAKNVVVRAEFGQQSIDVVADPLEGGTVLVVFRDTALFDPGEDDMADLLPAESAADELEEELRQTRHKLRSAVEELETANEELKSSNEEMMSMNEELQSTNEELSTVNDELKSKVDQLTTANSDLRNFLESTRLAVVVVDTDMRIRTYTEAALDVFPFQASDRGRRLTDVSNVLADDDLLNDARSILAGGEPILSTVSSREGTRHYAMRVMPYLLLDGSIDGATIVLSDITEQLDMQAALEEQRERLRMAVRIAGVGIWEYQVNEDRIIADETELSIFGLVGQAPTDLKAWLAVIDSEDRSNVEKALRRTATGGADFEETFRVRRSNDTETYLRGFGRLVIGESPTRIMGVTIDVTREMRFSEQRELMLREMNHRVKNLFAVIASIVSGAARSAPDVTALAETVRERIAALGRAHSLTQVSTGASEVPLGEIVREVVEPYRENDNVHFAGPAVMIRISELTAYALILHEWATNAVKYGGLGPIGAGLRVTWTEQNGVGLVIEWIETIDGEPNSTDARSSGFGSRLVKASLSQLGAHCDIDWSGRERRITLTVPGST